MATRKNQQLPIKERLKQTITELSGLGDIYAPPTSQEWAIAARFKLQSGIDNTKSIACHLKDLLSLVIKHEAYRTLHKENGEAFGSIEDFCQERQPWGLGYEKEALDQIIQERLERQRRLKLEGVPEDGRTDNGSNTQRGTKGFQPSNDYQQDVNNHSRSESAGQSRLRAIKDRAPVIVREFYEDDLIGEIEASKLGPLNPSEDRKDVIVGIVEKLEGVPKTNRTLQEKRDLKRQLNQMINQRMGTTDFKILDDPVKAAKALARRFKGDRRRQLIESLLSEPED